MEEQQHVGSGPDCPVGAGSQLESAPGARHGFDQGARGGGQFRGAIPAAAVDDDEVVAVGPRRGDGGLHPRRLFEHRHDDREAHSGC